MHYTKPHIYDSFHCAAGKCPDTCCKGWRIEVDRESLEYYAALGGSLGREIRNAIDWTDESFYVTEKGCCLQTDDGLCRVQLQLGEEALCDTCRTFPRHTEEFLNRREYSLSLSCPEAARLILSSEEMVYRQWEDEREDELEYEDFDQELFEKLISCREEMFSVLRRSDLDYEEKKRQIYALGKGLQEQYRKKTDWQTGGAVFLQDTGDTAAAMADDTGKTTGSGLYGLNEEQLFREEMQVLKGLEEICDGWDELLSLAEEYPENRDNEKAMHQDLERYKARLLEYYLYTYFAGAVYDGEILSKVCLCMFLVRWTEKIWRAYREKNHGILNMEEIIFIAGRFARQAEHSDENLNRLEEALQEGRTIHSALTLSGRLF